MCRLFGFRSRISLKVHHSLVEAENALIVQSRMHPDGWGLGYYQEARPRLVKGVNPAFSDDGFANISRLVTSNVLIAHVRKATVGKLSIHNTHPFQYGQWLFAHNGNIEGFPQLRPFFLEEMSPGFRVLMTGSTDSEHCFYLFLTILDRLDGLKTPSADRVLEALSETLRCIDHWSRILRTEPPILNFLVSDGSMLAATRFGRRLYYSTQKRSCSDYDACPAAQKPCLGLRIDTGPVTHLSISSEPISGEDIWEEMPDNSVLMVDETMNLLKNEEVIESAGPRVRTLERAG